MSDSPSFVARWSRRKLQARDAGPVVPDPAPAQPPAPLPSAETRAVPVALPQPADRPVVIAPAPDADDATAPEGPLAPTLDDVARLGHDDSFARYVARDVAPDVRQAAMKKLFTDPHFQVMDGLDIYIDDYGRPDPLPPGMLRQMVQSAMLGLFDDEEAAAAAQALAGAGADTTAQAEAEPPAPAPQAAGADAAAQEPQAPVALAAAAYPDAPALPATAGPATVDPAAVPRAP